MTSRLIQTGFLKGRQEFTIAGETVQVRIKTLFKEKEQTVLLSMLDPVPGVEESILHFHDRNTNQPVLSLRLNEPNPAEFEAFVDELKRKLRLAEQGGSSAHQGLAANSFDEPPEDAEPQQERVARIRRHIDVERVDDDMRMLRQHVDAEEVGPLLLALDALKAEPLSEANQLRVVETFNGLGFWQGAVLTYAPYIGVLISDNVMEDD